MAGRATGRDAPRRRLVETSWIVPAAFLMASMTAPAALAESANAELAPSPQVAQASEESVDFAIPSQALSEALTAFGRQAGLQVTVESDLPAGRTAPAVNGTMTPSAALRMLLAGSGLTWAFLDDGTVALRQVEAGADQMVLDPIMVEGSGTPATGDIGRQPAPYAGGQVARGGRSGILGNQDMMDAPFNVTAYTEDTIRLQQAETIGDVMENDPSVRTGYGFGNFSERFRIRGFDVYGEDVSVDGLHGNAPRQLVSMEMYERVEVMKGANAFLNGVGPGSSGVGGGINLVPKRADDEPLTRLSGDLANNARAGAHVDFGRRFGKNDAFGLRVNVAHRDGETSIEDEERRMSLGAAAFDYRGEDTRLTLDIAAQEHRIEQGRPMVQISTALVPDAPDADTNYGRDWSYAEMEDRYVQARVEHDLFERWTAHLAAGLRNMEESGDYATPTVNNLSGAATVGRMAVPREDSNRSIDAGIRGAFETGPVGHDLTFGVNRLETENRNSYDLALTNATINIYDPQQTARPGPGLIAGSLTDPPLVSESTLKSTYIGDTLSILDDRASLTLGLRNQEIEVRGYNRTTLAQTSYYSESALTPAVGLVVRPTEQLSLYGNYIEALEQGPTAPNTATNAGEIFAPYTSEQFEIGTKLDFGTIGGSLALFQISKPSGLTDPATNRFSVDGEQRHRGVELTLFGEPVPGTRLIGGVAYTRAELVDTAGGANDGKDAVGVPDLQANMGVEYDLPFLDRATIGARALYTAPQYLDAANSQEVPSWARLDLAARMTRTIDDRDVLFNLSVENVTNEAYWASAAGGYLTQGAPVTGKLSVSMDF